jgi:hypothetical protein
MAKFPNLLHNVGKTPGAQSDYLPRNTGVAMFETRKIQEYLRETYGAG